MSLRTMIFAAGALLFVSSSAAPAEAQTAVTAAAESTGGDQTSFEGKDPKKPERFEWFVANADVSYRALDLRKIEYDDEGGAHGRVLPATASGVSPGIGLGVRLWFVSLMLHGDVTFLSQTGSQIDADMELWNLDLESAFRMVQGRFQPFLLVGVGYSALAGVSNVFDAGASSSDAHGANARLGLGFDYYFTKNITGGFRAHADGLLLGSQVSVGELAQPEKVDTLGETKARLREADGSLGGFCYVAGLTFGVHYL